ncbi:DUF1573 domain-containing protein [Bacteroides hominis]|uniref:DUF1573 domain-containing protein n=1 Tax=Bacteroides hominis TaxID=2763023 RepID=UPI001D0E508E|nr:DUF1573 domain-containing protein [Bacteroides hominis (ex Afrizal et al. 2022)]MCC2236372.1 DUF1573 domain-containing protein [Bacteroides hominis (ex Afrizal et al. 2022)]MCY6326011.1 DUF1573 domain-containing protein [Bacteroides fragilis]
MRTIFIFVYILLFVSCQNSDKSRIARMIDEWDGKEIIYPDDLVFTTMGEDTAKWFLKDSRYTIVTYADSIGCMGCKLKLPAWKDFISYLDSVSDHAVKVIFILRPRDEKEMAHLIKYNNFLYPVCLDTNDSFNKINKIPSNLAFQTFLLDNKNKVIAIGNPIHNPNVRTLYLNLILSAGICESRNLIQTKISLPETIDMGAFDWSEEKEATLIIRNIGAVSLAVENIVTSCGCTSVEYSRKPVSVKDSLVIKVKYKAESPGYFNKDIAIYCNVPSSPVHVKLSGKAQ